MPDLALAEVDAELCSLLGQIVVRWSALEYLLSLPSRHFIERRAGGMMVITNNN